MKPPRASLWLVLALAPVSLLAEPTASPARLGSTVFLHEKLAAKPTGVGERRDVTDGPTATFERFESHVTALNAGQVSHPPHRHPQEELIILREGTLEVTINGVTTRAGPGSLLFFAANDFHNVKNVGDRPAVYAVFNFATAATRSAPQEGAAAAAAPGKLGSTVFAWDKLELKATKTGKRREVANSPTTTLANFECHVTTLLPGLGPHLEASNAIHHHPDEEIVLVREGELAVAMNGTTTRAGPGSIIFAASNEEHGWRNAGDSTATYYVIRIVIEATPPPPVPPRG